MHRLDKIYDNILNSNMDKISIGGVSDRRLKNISNDKRMSVTVIFRPEKAIADRINIFCQQLGEEFDQYYIYPAHSLHVTVLDIIPSAIGVSPTDIEVKKYQIAIEKAVEDIQPSEIEFRGITASDNTIIVKGYFDNGLDKLRNNIRSILSCSGLYFKERYNIETCHITAARLTDRLSKPEKLIEFVNNHSDFEFGKMTVDKIELTWHNRYDTNKLKLAEFQLKGKQP